MRNPSLRHGRILIIDDESTVVRLLRRMLESEGFSAIESTTDPFSAIRLFREFQPDLVILDMLMPGLDGFKVLAALGAIIPAETHLPILVVTGDQNMGTRREALTQGASDFVSKPYDPAEILARIENLLQTRSLHLELARKQGDLEKHSRQLMEANSALRAEVAARELVQEALQDAKAVAERASAAKSEFLSRMSHELRTPLNAILGFGQLLEKEDHNAEEADNVAQILKAGRHLLGLIDELLAISHGDDGGP